MNIIDIRYHATIKYISHSEFQRYECWKLQTQINYYLFKKKWGREYRNILINYLQGKAALLCLFSLLRNSFRAIQFTIAFSRNPTTLLFPPSFFFSTYSCCWEKVNSTNRGMNFLCFIRWQIEANDFPKTQKEKLKWTVLTCW